MDQITIGALTTCADIRTIDRTLSAIFSVNLGNRPANFPRGILTTQQPLHRDELKSIGLDDLFSHVEWTATTDWSGLVWYENFLVKAWRIEISAIGRNFDAGPVISILEARFPELLFSTRPEWPIAHTANAGNIEVTVEDPYGSLKLIVSSLHC